jgi:hypothetical protein
MLRLLFVFLCMSIGTCMICYGQTGMRPLAKEETYYRSILKMGVLSPFVGVASIQYEIKHTPNTSSQLEFFYFTGVVFGEITEYQGAGVTYNFRYYTKGTFPEGFYVQPFGRIQKYDYVGTQNPTMSTNGQAYEKVNVFGAGIVFGYQQLFTKHFVFDLCVGPVYNVGYADGERAVGPPVNGGWFRLGTSIGYAF